MADTKVEKALYGPSTTEVALGAVLGLAAGLLAACVYLVLKPVEQVKELPKEPKRGAVYYIPGSELTAKSRNWAAKEKQLVAGKSIELVEDELNAWANSVFGAPAAPAAPPPKAGAPAPAATAPAADGGIFQPGKPNFKIADGKLRIGFKCFVNWFGVGQEVFVVLAGGIRRSGDRFVFSADTVYLGSCPLHLLPVVPGPLVRHLLGKKPVSDELRSAWAKLADVTIEGSTLKLTMQ
ncbi:MAG: hypothetical protein ACOZE5_12010 [Verrucomicrobiota bacterium]